MKKWIYFLIAAAIISSPFYIIKSGYPQISDFLFAIAFLLFVFNYKIRKDKTLLFILILTVLISITNLTWGIVYSNLSFVWSIGYYIFNFLFLSMIINLYYYYKDDILNVIYKSVYISVILQVVISLFVIQPNLVRQKLFFNNPNQLGYYALLSFSILTLLFYILKKKTIPYLIVSILTIYLAALSNSSATLIPIATMLIAQILIVFIFRTTNIQKLMGVLLTIVLIFAVYHEFEYINEIKLIENILNRYESKSTKSESVFVERRYDRILEFPEYLFFGAGEGMIKERFGKGEIHSTLVSFLFNYGIITFLILVLFLMFFIKGSSWIPIIILLSIHFYGLTHNGIRQPLFWLVHCIILFGNLSKSLTISNVYQHLKTNIRT